MKNGGMVRMRKERVCEGGGWVEWSGGRFCGGAGGEKKAVTGAKK